MSDIIDTSSEILRWIPHIFSALFLFIYIKNMSYVSLTFRHDRGFGFGISVWIVTLVLARVARIWANSFCWLELWSKSVDWKRIRLMIITNLPFIDWTWRWSVRSSSSISTPHYLKQYICVVVCELPAYCYGNLPLTVLFRILVFWPDLFDSILLFSPIRFWDCNIIVIPSNHIENGNNIVFKLSLEKHIWSVNIQ